MLSVQTICLTASYLLEPVVAGLPLHRRLTWPPRHLSLSLLVPDLLRLLPHGRQHLHTGMHCNSNLVVALVNLLHKTVLHKLTG